MNQSQQPEVSRLAYQWWDSVAELVRYTRCGGADAHRVLELAERVVSLNQAHKQALADGD